MQTPAITSLSLSSDAEHLSRGSVNQLSMRRRILILAAVMMTSALAQAQPDPGDAVLAERFCELAQNGLRTQQLLPPHYRRSAALLEAAIKLNPTEPRYARLLVEANLQLKDAQGAIKALLLYRKLDPTDQAAQVRLIDLYAGAMETAEKKIAYLQGVVGKEGIPAEVRSQAASACAKVFFDRGQQADAESMLNQATRLNPLNLAALKTRYALAVGSRSPFERATILLAMLRVNPMQLDATSSLAELLAGAGLYSEALGWYNFSSQLAQKIGARMTPEFGLGYAALFYCFDQPASAEQITDALLQADPNNVDAWFLKLILDSSSGKADALADDGAKALNALHNQLAVLSKASGEAKATTRPINAPGEPTFPDFTSDIRRIEDASREDLLAGYRAALADLAWFYIYVRQDADRAGAVIESLKAGSDPGDVAVARLEGWRFLIAKRFDEARVKLSAVADRDPMAVLGLLRLAPVDDSEKQRNASIARQLVAQNPAGLLGAAIWAELRDTTPRLEPDQAASALREEVQKFPADWLKIIDAPHDFYVLRGEGLSVTHAFGEPLLARVIVQNISQFNLAIDAESVLKPDLWIEASSRGVTQQHFPGVAYERLSQKLVLKPMESTSQIVRVDQGALGQFLNGSPQLGIPVFGTVCTNPSPTANGIGAGPGGYRVQFLRVMDRTGTVINSESTKNRVYDIIEKGDSAERMRGIEMLAIYVFQIRANKDLEQMLPLASEFTDRITRIASAANTPSVRAWSNYLLTLLSTSEQRTARVEENSKDESWSLRALNVVLLQNLSPDSAIKLSSQLAENDAEPVVKKLAAATLEILQTPTTAPAANPTATSP